MNERISPEMWARVAPILDEALERPEEEWPELVESRCGGDAELRTQVLALLSAHRRAGDFLVEPALAPAAIPIQNRDDVNLDLGAVLSSRYRILSLLGRGGMGVVYKAHDQELDEVVAIKALRQDLAGRPDLARRLRSEIKLARRIRQPNVCAIHEFGQDGPVQYIVMEYVEGVTLKQTLKERGALPPPDAWALAIQLTDGLAAIHAAGIVHRDLKSTNIMLDARGAVRLMDFGIAKELQAEGSAGATATGQILGTPEYMSPEQAKAQDVDARSDLYSLGIVIFEMFTGDLPFKSDTPLAVILKHVNEPPPLRSSARLPPSLVPVLERALAKDPGSRPGSARELAEQLERARSPHGAPAAASTSELTDATAPATASVIGHAPVAPPRSVPRRSPGPARAGARPTRRNPAVWLAAGGLLLAAGLLAVWRLIPMMEPNPGSSNPLATAAPVEATSTPAGTSVLPSAPAAEPMPSFEPPPAAPPLSSSAAASVPSTTLAKRGPIANVDPRPRSSPIPGASQAPAPATPSPAPSLAAGRAEHGRLRLVIEPWAEVFVDGRGVGTTPLRPISLSPGDHTVLLSHPSFVPLSKKVTIRAGETMLLEVDLEQEAFPR